MADQQLENRAAIKEAILSLAAEYVEKTPANHPSISFSKLGKKQINGGEVAEFLGNDRRTYQPICYRWFSDDAKYAKRVPMPHEWNGVEDFFGVPHGEIARRAGLTDAPTVDLSDLINGSLRLSGTPVNLPETVAKTIVGLIGNDANLDDPYRQMVTETYDLARELSAAARKARELAEPVAPAAQPTFTQEQLLQNAS